MNGQDVGAANNKGKHLNTSNFLVHAVLVSIQVVFSGWHVLAQVALNGGVNPIALAMSREGAATMIMFVIARRMDGRVVLDRAHIGNFIFMGLASFGNVVGCILTLQYLSAEAFGMMQPSVPVIAMAMSYMTGVEGMSSLKCLGVIISVTGAVGLEYSNMESGDEESTGEGGRGSSRWIGCIFLSWQCFSIAALIVSQKPMLAIYPPATVTAWYYAVGSSFTLLLCAFSGVRPVDFLLTGKIEPWIALVYVVLLATVYTYNAYSWAINIVSPMTAVVYVTLQPASTTILTMIFLGTTLQLGEVVGGVTVVTGLLVTVYAKGLEQQVLYVRLRAEEDMELAQCFKTSGRGNRVSLSDGELDWSRDSLLGDGGMEGGNRSVDGGERDRNRRQRQTRSSLPSW